MEVLHILTKVPLSNLPCYFLVDGVKRVCPRQTTGCNCLSNELICCLSFVDEDSTTAVCRGYCRRKENINFTRAAQTAQRELRPENIKLI